MRPHCRLAQLRPVGCVHSAPARRVVSVRAAAAVVQDAEVAVDAESAKLRPVEKVLSVKVSFDDEGEPSVLYLTKWKVYHTH